MKQNLSKTVPLPFNGTVEKVKHELQNDGFGVIRIKTHNTPKKKMDIELHPFGVFFPCKVFIQELDTGNTEVSVIDPETLVTIGNVGLRSFATELRSLFEMALAAI